MRPLLIALAVGAFLATPLALAHGEEQHGSAAATPGRDTAQAQLDVSPAASGAVAVVERFSTALGTGDLDAAAAQLDPGVLILESGGAERTRAEYLAGHAGHDAAFLKAAHVSLKRRRAQASGDLAWVASESEIHATKGEDMLMVTSTETMVLRRTADGWRIVHIHWSSRRANAAR